MATNLALQLQVIEPDTDLNSIMIGNSRYSDDVWDLSSFIYSKTLPYSQKKINFSYIENADIKGIIKSYAYFKLGKIKPQTVQNYINGHLPSFIEYCNIIRLNAMSELTKDELLQFLSR